MASSIHESAADGGAVPGVLGDVQTAPVAAGPQPRRRSLARELVRRKTALAGLVLAVLVIGGALLAPVLAPADPLAMSPRRFATPSAQAWLGTDQFGRDLASRLVYGARVSMIVAFSAVTAAMLLGTTIGLLAGYLGGKVDYLLMRGVEVLMAFPTLLLALAVVATFGGSLRNLVLAIALAYVPIFSRVVRGSTLSVTHLEFVHAARALGARDGRIMVRHVLPNVLAPIIVQATFNLSTAIMIEAALSFLGLGVQPPAPSWGTMLSEARGFMELDPWLAIAPGGTITLAVLAFNLLGDGLRDILDPRLAGERSERD
ncbi:MAG: ABC transporter permease [Candidatus Rokubacteria bacterium]|nr:ABC transporter permease [Candidatus Rokubacteria bacterium]